MWSVILSHWDNGKQAQPWSFWELPPPQFAQFHSLRVSENLRWLPGICLCCFPCSSWALSCSKEKVKELARACQSVRPGPCFLSFLFSPPTGPHSPCSSLPASLTGHPGQGGVRWGGFALVVPFTHIPAWFSHVLQKTHALNKTLTATFSQQQLPAYIAYSVFRNSSVYFCICPPRI